MNACEIITFVALWISIAQLPVIQKPIWYVINLESHFFVYKIWRDAKNLSKDRQDFIKSWVDRNGGKLLVTIREFLNLCYCIAFTCGYTWAIYKLVVDILRPLHT